MKFGTALSLLAMISAHLRGLDRRLECFRLSGTTWQPVLDGEGQAVLAHPDWEDLTIRLADLWM
jgi:hypothetical protein